MNNNPYYRSYMNPYQNVYNQQNMYDQIDNQIAQLNQMKEQMKNNSNQNQQQPAINQTFQLAPNSHGGIRYVNSIDLCETDLCGNNCDLYKGLFSSLKSSFDFLLLLLFMLKKSSSSPSMIWFIFIFLL